ncbi:muscle M-line assembly protein unc-89-like isoform X2 [Haliotis cracherodii]|uniref:muscle M-line assembly protein unc-89-like isoform X2 n=1 Tax=Haliotis cracherodii TaxID=6455 RepID=UPI0039E7D8DB
MLCVGSSLEDSTALKVYDASDNLLARLYGDRRGYIVQSAVYYRVVFTTDHSDARKGFKAVWTVDSTEHARFGGYATLSWTLPKPGTRELSVCNSETRKCLLHITDYNNVRAANDQFTSRVRFIGNVSSSGTGLFRFTLSDVTLEDEGRYKCYRGSPDSGGPVIPNCGQNMVVPTAANVYARLGSTALLSWKLTPPGTREFTVRRNSSSSLLHVTNYNKVGVTSRYRTRAVFTGNIDSSGSGVFSFLLHDVVWSDGDGYICYRGSPGSRGDQMSDCGQRLVVIHIQDPYIVAPDTVAYDSSVTLACTSTIRTLHHRYITDVIVTWRKNGAQLETGGRNTLKDDSGWRWWYSYLYFYRSRLTIHDVMEEEEGDRYTCHVDVDHRWQTDWSAEYILCRTGNERYADYTIVRDGDNATVVWKMPKSEGEFYGRHPAGRVLLFVKSTDIYIWDSYRTRVKITGVTTLSAAMAVGLSVDSVTPADAGTYYCRGNISCDHFLVVSRFQDPYIVASNISGDSRIATLTCFTFFRYWPARHDLTMEVIWRRNHTELKSGGKYQMSAAVVKHADWYWTHSLTARDLERKDDGDEYTCRMMDRHVFTTRWSQEYAVVMNTKLGGYTNYSVTREEDKARVVWEIPNLTYKFQIWSPTSIRLLSMVYTRVYLHHDFISRMTLTVITSTEASVLWLQFYNVTPADAGIYYCMRTSDNDIIPDCTHVLVVSRSPEKPSMTSLTVKPESNMTSVNPEPASMLSCWSATRSLPEHHPLNMTFNWRRNGVRVHSGGSYRMTDASLEFNIKEENDTTYSCQAEEAGLTSDWSNSLRLFNPTIETFSVNGTFNLTAMENDTVVFQCCVGGSPTPWVSVINTDNGGEYAMFDQHLTIRNTQWNHTGEYICQASNAVDVTQENRSTVQLTVRSGPVITGVMVNGARNVTVNEGETVSFQCDVHGVPPPSVHVQQKETDSTHDVVLRDVNCTHTGTYVCVASNEIGVTVGKETVVINNVISQPRRWDSSNDFLQMIYNPQLARGTFSICSFPELVTVLVEYMDEGSHAIDMSASPRHKLSVQELSREGFYDFNFSISRIQNSDLGTYRLSFINEKGRLELFVELFHQGTTNSTTYIAIVACVIILCVAVAMMIVTFNKLKKFHERRVASSYISPIQGTQASTERVSYDGYHVYADIDDAGLQDNHPGLRMASNSSRSDDGYQEVGQDISAVHSQPVNQQPVPVADNQMQKIDVLEPYYTTEDQPSPQASSNKKPDTARDTSTTPYYLTATVDKSSPQTSFTKKPDTASTTPYYLTATVDKSSPQASSDKNLDTARETLTTPYYLTATVDKSSPQATSSEKPDTTMETSTTPYYLTATVDKSSPQASSSEKPDTARETSTTPYYLTATVDKSSPQTSFTKKPDTARETSTTPYYLTATVDKSSPQASSSEKPDTARETSTTPYYLTATVDKSSPQASSGEKPDTARETSTTPYYLTATVDKSSPQATSSKKPDTARETSTTPYYLTATVDKSSPQASSSEKPDTARETSTTPYYLTATVDKSCPQTLSSEKPDTARETSTTPYYLTATVDKASPQASSGEKPDTATETSTTPYYLTATVDKSSPQASSGEKPDTARETSTTPYYLTATVDKSSPQASSRGKPDTARETSTTPYYLTATVDKSSPQTSFTKKPDTARETSTTPYYLTSTVGKSGPQASSSKNLDTARETSTTPYYLTATVDKSSPQASSGEKPDTARETSTTPYYLTATVDKSSPQASSSEKPDTARETSTTPYYLTATVDKSSPQATSSKKTDTARETSTTPYYLTATVDKSSPQASSSEKPDTARETSTTPYYLTATVDKSSPQTLSSEKPDTARETSTTPYYLTATVDKSSPQASSSKKPDTAGETHIECQTYN